MSFPKKPRNPRMAYSGLTNMMRRLFAAYSEADETGVPVDEVLDMQREHAELRRKQMQSVISRRAFIKGAAAVGVAAAAGKTLKTVRRVSASGDANVVIIGAGLAGLRCAHKLANHGVASTIYEASPWTGGRTFSDTFSFPGQVVERGGSFISTEHNQVRNLANTLGLNLEVINGGALFDGEEIYTIDGQLYTFEQANDDWRVAWKAFKEDLQDAPWLQRYDSFTSRGQELDNIAVPDWFDPANPYSHPILADFGPDSNFAKLCYTDCISEYGGDADVQPALNLLYLLAWNPKGSIVPLAGTDEYYHVEGGNQQIADKLLDETLSLNDETEIHHNKALEAITEDAYGRYTCHFEDGSTATQIDRLVLTLPFRILRELNIASSIWDAFSEPKQKAITDTRMGTNAKIHLELNYRTWGPGVNGQAGTYNGVTYSDPDGYQLFWDDSVPVALGTGPVQLLNYLGGTQGASLKNASDPMGSPNNSDLNKALAQADSIFPGTSDAFTGNARQSFWAASQWHKGAYSFWGIGGYTTYVGAAGMPEGNIHFAGEHTSDEYQGYMEGAVETGRRAAIEVLQSI